MEKIYYMGYYYSPSFALMAIQEFVLFFFGIFIIIAVLAACYVIDVIIVMQFLKYGRPEFPSLSKKKFIAMFLFALATCFGLVFSITREFNDWQGAYAAFGQNLMMSVLFIVMLFKRNDLRGQSIFIGLFKMLGTAISSLAFYLYQPISQGSFILPFLFVSIFIYDIIYVVLIFQKSHEQNVPVWRD